MDKKDYIVLLALFLAAFFLWTLPLQKNPMPFGEGDSAYHFSYADYMASHDKSMGIKDLPNYIYLWYKGWNQLLGDNALEYPPPYHLSQAIIQIAGGDRIVAPYLFIAITCFLAIFSVYFLIRQLYGFVPATISGIALLFSFREIMTYLWGQRPSLMAFTYVPLIVYAYFKYTKSVIDKKENPVYLYITFILLVCIYMLHLQGLALVAPILILYTIFIALKKKMLPFRIKHFAIGCILFLLLAFPFINIYLGIAQKEVGKPFSFAFGDLLNWFKKPPTDTGYPPDFSTYAVVYGSSWFLLLVAIGALYVLYKRGDSDLVMVAWILSLYINIHIYILMGRSIGGGDERSLIQEAQLFYPLMAIAILAFVSLIGQTGKLLKAHKENVKYLFAGIFILLILLTTGKQAYQLLSDSYSPLLRITPNQFEAATWLERNTPADSHFIDYGTYTYPKTRWIQVISQRYFLNTYRVDKEAEDAAKKPTHIFIDYSDLIANNDFNAINSLAAYEKNLTGNSSKPMYNKNNIKVYQIAR